MSCLLLTAVLYWRIYLVFLRHKNQIQDAQQVQQNGHMTKFPSLRKTAVDVFYIYVLLLVCYLPRVIYFAALELHGPDITMHRFSVYSLTPVLLNSSLNPVIYCWRMRPIRHTILDILRDIVLRYRNLRAH